MALAALTVAACASMPPQTAPRVLAASADAPFTIDGRLSVKRGGEALAANFSWRHAPPRDELVLSTPLGQTLAEIAADASVPRYELRGAEGRREEARDWAALTERALGAPLPVDGLAAWIVGMPRAGTLYSIEPDAQGRIALLRQDGWEIVYAYADNDANLPARIQLSRFDIDARIVVVERR
jgi:outer membrane lipoprotein LolB